MEVTIKELNDEKQNYISELYQARMDMNRKIDEQ